MALLAPGAVVAGYRIESVVGRGGMGVVYRARELELDRVIALKVIAPELLEDAGVRARFLKEARAAASIEHPNVIPVHAAGERDGVAFFAMRLIDGDDLRALVRHEGPLGAGRAVELLGRAAAGLDAIHRAGYVHRDVKPANVLVDGDGHVYVTDFGLAKQTLSTGAETASGRWVGTLDYVAPEQIRGERVDARADVYALGGVLAFILTGRVPYERDADEAKLWAQLSDPPPVPSQLRPELPRALDAVIARAMAKRAEDRYPSAGDLGRVAR
ncbi:MAG TPA: serine/threonine-protein kinase, partial [Solirubrobacter sp.]